MYKIGIWVNLEKDSDFKLTKELIQISEKSGARAEIVEGVFGYNFVISLGGDGTFLATARKFVGTEIPIAGVNLGKLGYLTDINKKDIESAIGKLLNGEFKTEERFLLEATMHDKNLLALNEMVVNRGQTKLIDLKVSFDGKYVDNYVADGLIISTPTGSTAYSLSAGGPIIEPKLDVMVVTPICAHSLHQRPIVIGGNTEVTIYGSEGFIITADGQDSINSENLNEVTIKKSKKSVKVVKINDTFFFDTVREKFKI